MLAAVKDLYRSVITDNQEARKVVEAVRGECAGPVGQCQVLEIGCGYGRYLRKLSDLGFDVIGVEVNRELVRANRAAGLRCFTPEEVARSRDTFDVLLMSHVIEHFAPQDLVPFLDGYLDRLKPGGCLVIATPLLTRFFYDDFDHVKPYHPTGLLMVFGEGQAQVQYYARNKLRLKDVWMRRGYWRFAHRRARYVRSATTRLLQFAEFASAVAFRLSAGLIGQVDGWVGVFQKIGVSSNLSESQS